MLKPDTKKLAPAYVFRIETSRAFGDIIEAGLELLEMDASIWYDGEQARLEFYSESQEEAEARQAVLAACLEEWSDGDTWTTELLTVSDTDWSEYWKRFFHVARVSRRIVIKPSWEKHVPEPEDIIIDIDPGMSFGTGQHFSTASCLQFMDEFLPPPGGSSFLDVGCGSGILSIAAAKLGFRKIHAFDNDPNAVQITQRNLKKNGVTSAVDCRVADLEHLQVSAKYDVVVANMLSDLLIRFSGTIAAAVSTEPPGFLLLAGIMTPKYGEVKSAYEDLGFCEIRPLNDHEWTSGLFRQYT